MRTQPFWTARPLLLPHLQLQRPLARPVRLLSTQRTFMCASQRTSGFALLSPRSNNNTNHSTQGRLFKWVCPIGLHAIFASGPATLHCDKFTDKPHVITEIAKHD